MSLFAETWQNGRDPLPSNCTGDLFVKNIQQLQLTEGPEYHSSQDHSKWAVSADRAKPVLCVGGINRMLAQTTRGGGTFCFESASIHEEMSDAIQQVEECGGTVWRREEHGMLL